MADADPAVIAVEKCGCVTMAHVVRDGRKPSKTFEKDMLDVVRNGGSIVNTTVGEAKSREHFLPVTCPHTPKGWEPIRDA